MNQLRLPHIRTLLPVLLILVFAAPVARAATPANPLAALTGGAKPKTATPTSAPVTLSAAELNAAVATLQNPQQRNALIATLQAMSKSATAKAAVAANKAAREGVGERLVNDVSTRVGFVITDAAATLKSATDITLVWNWVLFVASDSYLRKGLTQTLARLALTLATALAAEYLVIAALSRMRGALVRRAGLIRVRHRQSRQPDCPA